MGYSTEFEGRFNLDKELASEHSAYLNAFSDTRRMSRNSKVAETLPDPIRLAAKLPIGQDGEFFVGNTDFGGQGRDESIKDYNHPPFTQPGLWCKWVVNSDNNSIEWDGGEKFYSYVEWLQYLITNFLAPWDYILNGEVKWHGEEWGDAGKIIVKDNKIIIKRMKLDE